MKRVIPVVALFLAGCASIVHQTTQQIPVDSEPAGAAITVACGDVFNDPKLVTPAVVTVHRKPDSCSIAVDKPGYEPARTSLNHSMSGWYLGNILIGGVVGLIVDAVNGAMYNRTPDKVHFDLKPAPATTEAQPPG